jgi:hypothetical protein
LRLEVYSGLLFLEGIPLFTFDLLGVGFAQTEQIPAMIRWLIGQLRARTPGGVWLMLGGRISVLEDAHVKYT